MSDDQHDRQHLERNPGSGEMPSDVDVQAERQQQGLEAEIFEEAAEERRHDAFPDDASRVRTRQADPDESGA